MAQRHRDRKVRECPSCHRGNAMTSHPETGRFCRFCGWDTDNTTGTEETERLTVYAGQAFRRGHQVRVVVAAPSKAAAMRALGVPRTEFRNFFHETERVEDVEAALSRPGVLFWQPILNPSGTLLLPWDADTAGEGDR